MRRWEVAKLDKDQAAKIAEDYGIPYFLAMLLDIRGFSTPEQIQGLLGGGRELSDPYLMKDMDKAVNRIRQAIDGFEKIAVYGDYDADGVTATAIVFTYLEAVGADVIYYIPQREGEGYGMNCSAVETLHQQGVSLIVTVDNGISSVNEVELAKSLGMDVVITDHHQPRENLPAAVAVVDAYQPGDASPFKDFCGAGVALKLLIALEDGDVEGVLSEYGDLAALGTVADVVPMLGENRVIVRAGLEMINRGGRLGIDALMRQCFSDKSATATSLAFTAIPRLNATGRMGAPERAVRLLTCEDEEEAESLAEEICEDNQRRRTVEADIAAQAIAQIENDTGLRYSRVIVVSGKDWHHGVIGIVASRITERFGKPCFVVSEDGEQAKGSGRSVEGFSLFKAACACEDLLERFGGHPMAAGINLKAENIPAFRERINQYAREVCPEMPSQVLRLDCKLNPAGLSPEMPKSLELLEPFGNSNPQPLFGLYGMELQEIVPVSGGSHLRLVCKKNGAVLNCMRFGVRTEDFPYAPGSKLDLAVTLDLREYRGVPQLTVNVRDIKLSGVDMESAIHSVRLYEKLRRREAFGKRETEELAPSRPELAALYRLLAARPAGFYGMQALLGALPGFTMGKLELCLDMMKERGLAELGPRGEKREIRLLPSQEKVNIFDSPIYKELISLSKL